jgi:glycosyltransferase involved in cell wall biosynthesis
LKVAIIHYWWLKNRGGEAVVRSIVSMFPAADVFFHVCDEQMVRRALGDSFTGRILNTFVSRLPFAKKMYQIYLPFMPLALESLDLSNYDLVISSESGPAKGIITNPNALHICYCHSPMRYLWDMHAEYMLGSGFLRRVLISPLLHYLRIWDVTTSHRVDHFIANSTFVSKRIMKFYRRSSTVIFPPVETSGYYIGAVTRDYYLVVGEFVKYKKVDLVVRAFNRMDKNLIIIGDGEMYDEIARSAGPNITLLGRASTEVLRKHYSECKALIFPGVEDFGIVPIEAMASGKPVLAYREGGALDYIVDGVTGLFFDEQNEDSIISIVDDFELVETNFDPVVIRDHSIKFDSSRFNEELSSFIDEARFSGSKQTSL